VNPNAGRVPAMESAMDLSFVVWLVAYLLVAGLVFGLLFFLIDYVAREFHSEPMQLFAKVAKVILVVVAVLVLIGILLSAVPGGPTFRWGSSPLRVN
jgi:formate hydrogenlyase subunit 3/multisubunit Na+/H+ antiporter MnhD subunit